MKVVVTGGAGAMAWPGEIYLLGQSDVTELVIADISKQMVDRRIEQLGRDKRIKGAEIDLMDVEAAAQLFDGADVVYNAAFMTTCTQATKAALKAKVNYLDLGGFEMDEQLAMDTDFNREGITGICGMGTAPGMSNIMCAYGVEQLDKPESIEILDACVDIVPDTEHTRPLYWGYAIEGIIDEFVLEAPYFDDGELKYVPARSYAELVDFRPPVGQNSVSVTPHTEQISLSRTFKDRGVQHVSWKIGFDSDFEEKMTFLRDLGLFSNEPIDVNGQSVSPRSLVLKLLHNQREETNKAPDFRGHMIAVVKGEESGKKVEYTITEYATSELTLRMQEKGVYSSYRTGIYGAIAATMIGRGQIEKKGVLYPEVCVPPGEFLKQASEAGIEVDVSRKEWL